MLVAPTTLYDKLWNSHVVTSDADGNAILYIDLHLVHEVTSPQAFEGLRAAGRKVHAPEKTIAVPDHNVPTTPDRLQFIKDPEGRLQLEMLNPTAATSACLTSPWPTFARATCTIIGPSRPDSARQDHRLRRSRTPRPTAPWARWPSASARPRSNTPPATQTLAMKKSKNMRVAVNGTLPAGVTLKDVVLGDHRQDRHVRRTRATLSNTPAMSSPRCPWKAA